MKKLIIPNTVIDQALDISITNKHTVLILKQNTTGEVTYQVANYDHQANYIRQVIAELHYSNGSKIHNDLFHFESDPKIRALMKKAKKIRKLQEEFLPEIEKSENENKEWHKRFRMMKIKYELDNYKIAAITGNKYNSVRSTTQPSKELPRNLKLAVWISEQE